MTAGRLRPCTTSSTTRTPKVGRSTVSRPSGGVPERSSWGRRGPPPGTPHRADRPTGRAVHRAGSHRAQPLRGSAVTAGTRWTVLVVQAGPVAVTVTAMHPDAATPAQIAIAVLPSTTSSSPSPISTNRIGLAARRTVRARRGRDPAMVAAAVVPVGPAPRRTPGSCHAGERITGVTGAATRLARVVPAGSDVTVEQSAPSGSPVAAFRPALVEGACRGNRVPEDDECGRERTRALDLRRPVRPGRRLPIT